MLFTNKVHANILSPNYYFIAILVQYRNYYIIRDMEYNGCMMCSKTKFSFCLIRWRSEISGGVKITIRFGLVYNSTLFIYSVD